MLAALYDPQGIVANAFARANHTGTQAIATVSGLQSALDAKALTANPVFTGTVTLAGDPSADLHAATKQYVDGIAANLGKRSRVRAATTANITIAGALNNGDTLDGVTLATGDLVLVKDQTTAAQNGVYVVGATPVRAQRVRRLGRVPRLAGRGGGRHGEPGHAVALHLQHRRRARH